MTKELSDEQYRRLYQQESERRRRSGHIGPPFVTKKPTLMCPQNSDYKRWLEEDLELNVSKDHYS